MQFDYDMMIIGAGLVGTSLAVALADQGLKIALLEKHLPNISDPKTADMRPISLNYGSVQILDRYQIWSSLSQHACPIKAVHVSEEGRLGSVKFTAEQQAKPALGYVVPFAYLQQALYKKAALTENVSFLPIEDVSAIELYTDHAHLTVKTMQGEQSLTTHLLVACDGTRSRTRQLLNIPTRVHDHQEMAITAEIHSAPHDYCAYERFASEGTLAILPLPEQRNRLVWTTDQAQAKTILTMDKPALLARVQRIFRDYLGTITDISITGQYPLQTVLAQEQVRDSFVLLGNAAHTLYPVAAQGFNLGLRDVRALSHEIINAHQAGENIGDKAVLARYYAKRQRDQQCTAKITQGISAIFGMQLPLAGHLRGTGLLAMDLMPKLKQRFANQLMGL